MKKLMVNFCCPFTWIGFITFGVFLPLYLSAEFCQLVPPASTPEHNYLFTLASKGSAEQNQFLRSDILSRSYFYVGGHGIGNPSEGIVGLLDNRERHENILDVKTLAEIITREKKNRGIPEDLPVFLLSCNSGAGKHPYAQMLSDILNVEVIAPTEWLVIDPYGNVRTGLHEFTAYFHFGRLSLKRFFPN